MALPIRYFVHAVIVFAWYSRQKAKYFFASVLETEEEVVT